MYNSSPSTFTADHVNQILQKNDHNEVMYQLGIVSSRMQIYRDSDYHTLKTCEKETRKISTSEDEVCIQEMSENVSSPSDELSQRTIGMPVAKLNVK